MDLAHGDSGIAYVESIVVHYVGPEIVQYVCPHSPGLRLIALAVAVDLINAGASHVNELTEMIIKGSIEVGREYQLCGKDSIARIVPYLWEYHPTREVDGCELQKGNKVVALHVIVNMSEQATKVLSFPWFDLCDNGKCSLEGCHHIPGSWTAVPLNEPKPVSPFV